MVVVGFSKLIIYVILMVWVCFVGFLVFLVSGFCVFVAAVIQSVAGLFLLFCFCFLFFCWFFFSFSFCVF